MGSFVSDLALWHRTLDLWHICSLQYSAWYLQLGAFPLRPSPWDLRLRIFALGSLAWNFELLSSSVETSVWDLQFVLIRLDSSARDRHCEHCQHEILSSRSLVWELTVGIISLVASAWDLWLRLGAFSLESLDRNIRSALLSLGFLVWVLQH